ncbi:PHD-zinc-finger like domain-containing protein [Suillus discolor]|uniref:PHD-zinc-finger like domain-containing protein n=1 Tax=Suillus discolor TaxID=1912936 RepID=A0A9P7F319_9AGAM|nr:PHD-zinc-finger like domain-containing protein [Suillus discolor]KAG2103066.1 PHD-zinc-finger like domain-containing protein [Suillus discolor]
MTRGFKSPAAQVPLPKVSFIIVQDDDINQPAGVHDLQARSYGYNDFTEFLRPDHYIRYIEPLEKDLAIQVEYDMDDQADQEWLDAANVERKKDQLNAVTYETFEIIMDRLEKEYFDLTKNIPKSDYAMPSEDSTCAICDDSEGENSNAIVFCDGCNLAVHQDCYGVPYIPEGQWLCRKCTVSPENLVSCILCPNEGGAFKQTVFGDWAHLLCAIWIPETRVANEVFMEPITGSDKIPKQRWKLKCSICGIREGACIQCTKNSCFLAFHTTCARKERLLMPMKSSQGSEPGTLACYCEKHLPKEQQDARLKALAQDGQMTSPNSKLSKSARAYAKTYKTGPPLVPHIIVERILNYITKVNVRKKNEFVYMVCKYWSLKREARRGAPLLKRLHLEPWTASNSGKVQTEEEKTVKLEYLKKLRGDLESVRELTLQTRRRESRKLAQTESIQKVLEIALFPHEALLRLAFEKVLALDRHSLFKHPVSRTEVPDYYDVVKTPMTWDAIDGKLDRHEYWDLEGFKSDIELVLSNAILYNKPGTSFYKTAQRIQISSQPILQELNSLAYNHSPLTPPDPSDSFVLSQVSIGDLEPLMETLQLLTSTQDIQDNTNLLLHTDPISSLFSFELPLVKPPPPPAPAPSPPPPKSKVSKKKRTPKTVEPGPLDTSPGFRAPRTRRARAAAAAFEAEAGFEPEPQSTAEPELGVIEGDQKVASEPPKKRRRQSAMPGQAETPPMVTDVDSQGLFKMFDAGWILPSGQRRGGRQPVERAPLPPKKKKIDRGMSRLSVFSTNASDNQTLDEIFGPSGLQLLPEPEPQPEVEPQVIIQPKVTELERDREETRSELEARIAKIPVRPNTKINVENGKIVVEELDTPKLRREKARQRKAEKAAAAAAAAAAAQGLPPPNTEIPKTNVGTTQDDVSDLSSLSELDSDSDEKPTTRGEATTSNTIPDVKLVGTRQLQRAPANLVTTGKALVVLEPGKQLEYTYPWWPAVVWEPDDPAIPEDVRKKRPQDNSRHIVQFYDPTSSWTWVTTGHMLLLGEDNAVDASLLSPTSVVQKWKTPRIKKQCREAFGRALAEMETDADLLAHETEDVATEVTSAGSMKEQGPTDVHMAMPVEQSAS